VASAVLSPAVIGQIDPTGAPLTDGQTAFVTALATLAGGSLAGLAGQNAIGGATAAENEALNNSTKHPLDETGGKPGQQSEGENDAVPIVPPASATSEEAAGESGQSLTVGQNLPVGALGGVATNTAAAGSAADMTTAAQLRTQLSLQQAGILDSNGQFRERRTRRGAVLLQTTRILKILKTLQTSRSKMDKSLRMPGAL
jgi:hypothetical protein